MRDGDWKLVVNAPAGSRGGKVLAEKKEDKVFLSNMAEDVTETKNLAKKHPDVVERLTKLHEQWAKEVSQQ